MTETLDRNDRSRDSIARILRVALGHSIPSSFALANKILAMPLEMIEAFVAHTLDGKALTISYEDYTVDRIRQTLVGSTMDEISAFIHLDWIRRKPERAIRSLDRGYDYVVFKDTSETTEVSSLRRFLEKTFGYSDDDSAMVASDLLALPPDLLDAWQFYRYGDLTPSVQVEGYTVVKLIGTGFAANIASALLTLGALRTNPNQAKRTLAWHDRIVHTGVITDHQS